MSQTDISKRQIGEIFTAYKASILREDELGSTNKIELGIYPSMTLAQEVIDDRSKGFKSLITQVTVVKTPHGSYELGNRVIDEKEHFELRKMKICDKIRDVLTKTEWEFIQKEGLPPYEG